MADGPERLHYLGNGLQALNDTISQCQAPSVQQQWEQCHRAELEKVNNRECFTMTTANIVYTLVCKLDRLLQRDQSLGELQRRIHPSNDCQRVHQQPIADTDG